MRRPPLSAMYAMPRKRYVLRLWVQATIIVLCLLALVALSGWADWIGGVK